MKKPKIRAKNAAKWKAIEAIWKKNRNVDPEAMENDISKALREVRKFPKQ